MPSDLRKIVQAIGLFGFIGIALAACGGDTTYDYPTQNSREAGKGSPTTDADRAKQQGLFGPEGLNIFGSSKKKDSGEGIGVNSYLWRGALDTISFMPLVSADPFGGVIITDWYQPPETPGERIKVHILILDRELRADGVRATVFRQKYADKQGWVDVPVDPKTPTDLENTILTRARQLRIAQNGS